MNSNWKKIGLSEEEIKKIKETAYEIFGKEVKIYIFRSRIVPDKRRGDIDILIKSPKQISVDEKLSFLAKLELKGIERKVDLVTISSETNFRNIHIEALKTGVEI